MIKKMTVKCKVTKEEEITFGEVIQCDKCMKTIYDSTTLNDSERYYDVTIGHRDWPEAYEDNEYFTLCSDKCLQQALEYFESFQKEYKSPYMDIEVKIKHHFPSSYQKPDYLSDEEWKQLKKEAKETIC